MVIFINMGLGLRCGASLSWCVGHRDEDYFSKIPYFFYRGAIDNALVIFLKNLNSEVKCVLIDTVRSTNIIYLRVLKEIRVTDRMILVTKLLLAETWKENLPRGRYWQISVKGHPRYPIWCYGRGYVRQHHIGKAIDTPNTGIPFDSS